MNLENCKYEIQKLKNEKDKINDFKNNLPYESYDFTYLNDLKVKLWDSIRNEQFRIKLNNPIVTEIFKISNEVEQMKLKLAEFYIENDYIVTDPFKHSGFFILRKYAGSYGIPISNYLDNILKIIDKKILELEEKKEAFIIDEVDKLLDTF